jgi:hypothetical protein
MKRGRTRSLLVFALLAAPPALARAQDISVFAGGLFPGSASYGGASTPLERGPVYGVRLSTPFAKLLKLEHTLAFSNDFLVPRGSGSITGARGLLFHTNLLASVPAGAFVPFVTAGLGFVRQYGAEDLPVGTKFAINYGGGLKLPRAYGPLGLRFDARGYRARGVFSGSVHMFELSAGIVLGF